MLPRFFPVGVIAVLLTGPVWPGSVTVLRAQTAVAPASGAVAAARALGTVRSVSGTGLVVATDAGATVNVALADAVRVQQLPPGSTDIKAAQTATVADIAVGDRVLVVGRAAEGGALTATRVVLMKSGAIAQNNATRQADWQQRGSGGLVSAVDPAAGTVSLLSGAKKVTVTSTKATVFRRYAPGSVKFEEATVGTMADLQPGDQLRVRGTKSADGNTIAAEEIVSGAFRNLAGTVVAVDAAANTVTLKDLATKKNVVVAVGAETDLRNLPPEMAARVAARARGGAAAGPAGTGVAGAGTAGTEPAGSLGARSAAGNAGSGAGGGTDDPGARPAPTQGSAAAGTGAYGQRRGAARGAIDTGKAGSEEGSEASGAGGAANVGQRGEGRTGGGDLAALLPRLPKTTLAELKPGAALMIVASGASRATGISGASGGSGPMTAITVISGVEPLLTATSQGAANFAISPLSLGGGGGEGGGDAGTP